MLQYFVLRQIVYAFYRSTLCYSAVYAVPLQCMSVQQSNTIRYYRPTKTAKHILTQTTPQNSPSNLAF